MWGETREALFSKLIVCPDVPFVSTLRSRSDVLKTRQLLGADTGVSRKILNAWAGLFTIPNVSEL